MSAPERTSNSILAVVAHGTGESMGRGTIQAYNRATSRSFSTTAQQSSCSAAAWKSDSKSCQKHDRRLQTRAWRSMLRRPKLLSSSITSLSRQNRSAVYSTQRAELLSTMWTSLYMGTNTAESSYGGLFLLVSRKSSGSRSRWVCSRWIAN